MADPHVAATGPSQDGRDDQARARVRDGARAHARQRFRDRLQRGEKIGGCDCASEEASEVDGPDVYVVGVRFRDSGQVYFFSSDSHALDVGAWVVVPTSRGDEAARVVIAPRQMLLAQLDGELKPVQRVLGSEDIEQMERFRRESARAIKTFGELARAADLPIKPISAEYSFDGQHLQLNYSAFERINAAEILECIAGAFESEVTLTQVGPRDEARLLGGLGRCGRTLCCSSWLPMFPDVSMGMAKNQDLSLNPTKVSGVCGRLLCCLSYENEQYKKAKAIMPRLGQRIQTPDGEGMVISMQVLRELVTVRLAADNRDQTYQAADLGLASGPSRGQHGEREQRVEPEGAADVVREPDPSGDARSGPDRRRRRRRGRGGHAGQPPAPDRADGL